MCKSSHLGFWIWTFMADWYSDAHNPEHAAKQIMSIAPIVPGQKESSQFQTSPHKPKDEAHGHSEYPSNVLD